ncbi:uncharacterized lipoprotein YehR (DUF1307 family) [Streptomyces sp. LBL]|nr:hypothetical protein [Streptomyces sp. LBL]MDH6626895.1 uncharacterized lipoprotein YehR (DUF1307 family) [Streptomyces sp. LBL]
MKLLRGCVTAVAVAVLLVIGLFALDACGADEEAELTSAQVAGL